MAQEQYHFAQKDYYLMPEDDGLLFCNKLVLRKGTYFLNLIIFMITLLSTEVMRLVKIEMFWQAEN